MLIFPPRELFVPYLILCFFLLPILVRTFAGETVEISSVLRGGELEERRRRDEASSIALDAYVHLIGLPPRNPNYLTSLPSIHDQRIHVAALDSTIHNDKQPPEKKVHLRPLQMSSLG